MYESTTEFLRKWNATKSERQKLQDAYLFLGIGIVIASGLIIFVNNEAGYTLVGVGLLFLAAFLINGIAWHILSSTFLSKLGKPNKKPTKKK